MPHSKGEFPRIALLRNVHRNLGDEAMLACEISMLRERFGGNLIVLTDEPDRVRACYGVEAAYSDVTLINPWQGAAAGAAERTLWAAPRVAAIGRFLRHRFVLPRIRRKFLTEAKRTDAHRFPGEQLRFFQELAGADVVVSGGGLIPSVAHMEAARSAALEAVWALGKPVVLHGQTIYRRNDPAAPYRFARTLVTRDSTSKENALSCGFDDARIVEGVDPAFSLPLSRPDATEAMLTKIGLGGARFAAVNIRSGLDAGAIVRLARRIRSLASQGHFERVLLFGMQSHAAENDLHAILPLRSLLGDLAVEPVIDWPTPAMLKAVIGRAEWVAGCRYHAAVFALTMGRPLLALSVSSDYDLKLSGILAQFGKSHWLERPSVAPSVEASNEREWFRPEARRELTRITASLAGRRSVLARCVSGLLKEACETRNLH